MTSTPDRRGIDAQIDTSMSAGARQYAACAGPARTHPAALDGARGLGAKGLGAVDDCRPLAEHPKPASKLSEEERERIVASCNAPEFASLPPSQIVLRLAGPVIWPGHLDRASG